MIFLGLNMGFKTVYLTGADHSWYKSFFLDDKNKLYYKDEHFYNKEEVGWTPFYKNVEETEAFDMAGIFTALSRKFKGYQELERYSKFLHKKVYNISKESSIGAFERFEIKVEKP